jgi:dTDP-4-dehydrorhamnose 3,5-epimerase
VRVARGRAFVVAVDIRKNSPTRGKWESRELTEESQEALYLPFGFGSGFCALEDDTEIEYYMSDIYDPSGESNVLWNDPTFTIAWPVSDPLVSDRDKNAQTFEAWLARPESDLIS